jgi:hypothetical protein
MIPLFEKRDIKDCNNYRGIFLLSSRYKLISKLLKIKLYKSHDKIIDEVQTGFCEGISCADGYL